MSSRWIRAYIIPGAVFQSVVIAGGYGTGRELVEYFTRYGARGGLLAMAVTVLCWAAVLIVTFEFARVFQAYDYRSFFKRLIGRGWIAFEVLYVLMFLLVLAVVASAAGEIMRESFGLPYGAGLALMLGAVAALNFFGREVVTRSLALWTVVMYCIFVTFFVVSLRAYGPEIVAALRADEGASGWALSGFQYALYNLAIVPAILFAVRAIETRRQAVGAGAFAAVLCIIPALLFHVSFLGGYPAIIDREIPVYWMLAELAVPALLFLYMVGLFGTFIETGAGFIQGINERIDAYLAESRGSSLPRPVRALIALVAILLSAGLATFGIIRLIADGYGTIAWGFFAVYMLPIMTYGVYLIWRNAALPATALRPEPEAEAPGTTD
jgi:uncharacterized membrane protein YkvI